MPNTFESYASRLASFNAPHPATKKRASDPKGSKKLKWPHKHPSPPQLAQAGFYYNPTSSCPDNATCYLCNSNLDGWEETDDPVVEHISHCQHCGWAITVSIEQSIEKGADDFEDPLSEQMMEARRMTFATGWPHENKRGWLCKVQKMIEAGWHYAPTPESDDFVKCSYCSLSLDGWEPKDKPYQEHQRRSPECLFFRLVGSSKPKGTGRSRKERSSKASRLSTQSNLTVASDAPSFADAEIGGDDSILSTATVSKSKPTKGGKKAAKGKKGAVNKKTTAKVMEEPSLASSYIEPEDDDFSVKVDPSPEPVTKGRKRQSHQISKADHGNLEAEDPVIESRPIKRRATRTRGSVLPAPQQETMALEKEEDIPMYDAEDTSLAAAPAPKKGNKSSKKKGSSRPRQNSAMSTASKASLRVAVTNDDDLDASLALDLDRPLTDDEEDVQSKKAGESKSRRLTRTKPGTKAATASVAPTRRTTRASTAAPEASALNVHENIEDLAIAYAEVEHSSGTNTSVSGDAEPEQPLTKKTKRAGQKKAASKEIARTAIEDIEQSQAQPITPGIVDHQEDEPQKQPESRPVSRQALTRAARTSMMSTSQDTAMKLDSSLHADQILADDSGHETDASVATQGRGSRRKPSTAKKGRKGKKSQQQHRNLEDIVHSSKRQTVPEDLEVDQPFAEEMSEQTQAPEPPAQAKKGTKVAKKSAKSSKGKKAAGRPKAPTPEASPAASVDGGPASPVESKQVTPVVSPQSSDAENQPPSSRPSALRPPLSATSTSVSQPIRIPLADRTPVQSPSKNTFSKLQTTMPWTSVDLELIFQNTPSADKENKPFSFGANAAETTLTSPEKKLSVEQWIDFKAQGGEEKLRAECERLVSTFEGEGMRALKTLEGIVCTEQI